MKSVNWRLAIAVQVGVSQTLKMPKQWRDFEGVQVQ